MVDVTVSEIYDMNTVQDKMGVIGVHTPSFVSIDSKWHGYFLNHRFFRIKDCSVQISCASMLPLDPLGIGTQPGKVAPQDVMNPILYRAVSNDAWNVMVGRLYATTTSGVVGDIEPNSVRAEPDAFPSSYYDQEQLYYSLLASGEWRKAMPQQGLNMDGLRPFCYPIVSTFGQGEAYSAIDNALSNLGSTIVTGAEGRPVVSSTTAANENRNVYFRGPASPLPRFPCTPRGIVDAESELVTDHYAIQTSPSIPRIYVGCIVMPPAKMHAMYYRMKVSWRISFEEPVSILEKRNFPDAIKDGPVYYKRSYDFTYDNPEELHSADNTAIDTNTVDTVGFEPKLVMEK